MSRPRAPDDGREPSPAEWLLDVLAGSPVGRSPVARRPAAWDALVDEALRHGLAPVLLARLPTRDDLRPPADVERRLRDVYLHGALRHEALRAELHDLLAALARAAVPVVALKGAHLAELVYGDPALRSMADLDLLVPPDRIEDARAALFAAGYHETAAVGQEVDYARHQHVCPFDRHGVAAIELHRSLVPDDAPFALDLDALWARARPACIAGVNIRVLAPDDLVRHLALHVAYVHRFAVPLLSLHDIAAAIRAYRGDIHWARLAGSSNADGSGRLLYTTLSLVRDTTCPTIPSAVLDAFDHRPEDAAIARAARACILTAGVELPGAILETGLATGRLAKWKTIARAVFPAPERLRAIHRLPRGSRAVYAYYPIRLLHLVRRRGRVMVELLLRRPRASAALGRAATRRTIERWVDGAASAGAAGGVPP